MSTHTNIKVENRVHNFKIYRAACNFKNGKRSFDGDVETRKEQHTEPTQDFRNIPTQIFGPVFRIHKNSMRMTI